MKISFSSDFPYFGTHLQFRDDFDEIEYVLKSNSLNAL
jgi:hypothetical protein